MRRSPHHCQELTSWPRPEDGPAGTSRCHGSPSKNACRYSASNVPLDSSSSDQDERARSVSPYSARWTPRAVSHIQRKLLLQSTPVPPESIVHHHAFRNGRALERSEEHTSELQS